MCGCEIKVEVFLLFVFIPSVSLRLKGTEITVETLRGIVVIPALGSQKKNIVFYILRVRGTHLKTKEPGQNEPTEA